MAWARRKSIIPVSKATVHARRLLPTRNFVLRTTACRVVEHGPKHGHVHPRFVLDRHFEPVKNVLPTKLLDVGTAVQCRVSEHPAYQRNTNKGEDESRLPLRWRIPLLCLRAPPGAFFLRSNVFWRHDFWHVCPTTEDNFTFPSAQRTPKSERMSSPSPLSSSLNPPLENILFSVTFPGAHTSLECYNR